jgi:hypothetical protein
VYDWQRVREWEKSRMTHLTYTETEAYRDYVAPLRSHGSKAVESGLTSICLTLELLPLILSSIGYKSEQSHRCSILKKILK